MYSTKNNKGDRANVPRFFADSRFYQFLFQLDRQMAAQVLGGRLRPLRWPVARGRLSAQAARPRGELDASYATRLSFCCSREGCRRRTTPPSVRFLGRKLYLGVVVVLVTALEHGPRRDGAGS